MARRASRRGLLLGAAAAVLLVVAGLWWATGSFSEPCQASTSQAPDGALTTTSACAPAPSRYEQDGLVGVLWTGVPAAMALTALALTPLPRVRAPARWLVGVTVLVLGLLTAFTPFLLLLLPAGGLMVLAAVHAHAPGPDS